MPYWLLKSEPEVFSFEDLFNSPDQTTAWEGVRNYQARNWLRDGMRVDDRAFFYHSSCARPGIVGIVRVVRAGYPDATAFDPQSPYYDPKSDPASPRWYRVDVRYERPLARLLPLEELRRHEGLADMPLIRRGNRLSVMPVTPAQWSVILALEHRAA